MKKIRKAATLLITTIVMSFVTITTAVFSGIYFRYNLMNVTYREDDREKIQLYQNANITFESFLKNENVKDDGNDIGLRTKVISLPNSGTFSTYVTSFIVNFSKIDNSNFDFEINGKNNYIKSTIKDNGSKFELNILRVGKRNA